VTLTRSTIVFLAVLILTASPSPADERSTEARAVDAVLTAFHDAASRADSDVYFKLLSDDAIYLGTDAGERWTVDEFKAFAEPYFSEGRGWTYTATSRNIVIGPGGSTAWFDELLWNESYGTCRGTGVLVASPDGWRIAQYHLTFPVPNELAEDIVALIMDHEAHEVDD
jgi:ketosteroid isomerase-like protein